jgi:predicted AlkP superfamily phosphohydrolase/phosphomutase
MNTNHNQQRRTLIFGIDGGTWEVLTPLMDKGIMPVLKGLKDGGAWGTLYSVIPVNSAAAWSSMLTGMSPAEHGVFDFLSWNPNTKNRTAVNSTWLPRPTLIDLMGEAGPVLSLKVPMTYPPWSVNGQIVSGLPTPDDESAFTYPEDLAVKLNPMIESGSACRSWELEGDRRDIILDQVEAAQRVLEKMTEYLLEEGQPQTCFVVARDIDELQHFFWDALSGSDTFGYKHRLEQYFQKIDTYLGRMLDWAGKDARIIVHSDHGFGPVTGIWHLNEWLRSRGFLGTKVESEGIRQAVYLSWNVRLKFALGRRALKAMKHFNLKGTRIEQSLAKIRLQSVRDADLMGVDWGSTLAYAGNGGEEYLSLHINLKDREPNGIVPPEQYEKVREDLRSVLLCTTDPEVVAVHRSEDIFDISDPRATAVPDLIVQTAEGNVKSDFCLNPPADYEASKFVNGCHRREGMFLFSGPDVIPSEGDASLLDIPATVIAWQGIPIPNHFRGQPLHKFINNLSEAKREDDESRTPSATREFFSEEEEAGVRKKLESLGYL